MNVATDSRRSVSGATATSVIFRALIRGIAGRRRLLILALGTAAFIAIGWLIGRTSDSRTPEAAFATFADDVLLRFLIPMLALIACSSGLPEARSEGTLIYLWLRPVKRVWLALASWLAAFVVIVPFAVAAAIGTAIAMGTDLSTIGWAAVSGALATAAYTAVFTLLGMLTRAGTIIALGYIVFWEGFLARFGAIGRYSSIERYAVSLIANHIPEVASRFKGYPSTWLSFVVLIGVVVVSLAATTWRLNKMTVT